LAIEVSLIRSSTDEFRFAWFLLLSLVGLVVFGAIRARNGRSWAAWEFWVWPPLIGPAALGLAVLAAVFILPLIPIGLALGAIILVIYLVVRVLTPGKPVKRALEKAEPAGWTPTGELPPEHVKLRAWMRRMAEPAYLCIPAKTPRFAKMGGTPELPDGVGVDEEAHNTFLVQLDLAELPEKNRSPWLPVEGRLYAFVNPEALDLPDTVKVIYSTAPVEPREDLPEDGPIRRIRLKRFKSAPSMDWLGPEAWRLFKAGDSDADLQAEAAGATEPSFGGISHRFAGFPEEIQPDWMAIIAERLSRGLGYVFKEPVPEDILKASKDWRLLFQFDSDEELGWRWSDAGRLYVLVRREDALRSDFSKTVTVFQFH
jgi:hypothetical protein